MRVVFLDMDGVLNSQRFFDARLPTSPLEWGSSGWWAELIDPSTVPRLNRILAQTGACVVLSSSWRDHVSPERMQKILECRGFTGRVIGRTPLSIEMPKALRKQGRGAEIEVWLAKNKHLGIESFAILDDAAPSAFGNLQPHLVKTTWGEGLLEEHVEAAVKLLRGQ